MADNPPVPGYPGFTADSNGDVWCNGRVLKGVYDTSGYLWVNGVLSAVLVCSAFHGAAPTPDATVTHLDGVNGNDQPTNLAWAESS